MARDKWLVAYLAGMHLNWEVRREYLEKSDKDSDEFS
jgi:hypothetical protein